MYVCMYVCMYVRACIVTQIGHITSFTTDGSSDTIRNEVSSKGSAFFVHLFSFSDFH
jgi:hypothetical protein